MKLEGKKTKAWARYKPPVEKRTAKPKGDTEPDNIETAAHEQH